MKLVNSHYLLIAALLGLSTLFDSSYPLAKAQSEPKPGCQATVDKILQEIRSKGVEKASFRVLKGTANNFHTGNPTNRTDELQIILGYSFYSRQDPVIRQKEMDLIEKILNSGILLNWSNDIVSSCNNTAIVTFGPAGSDNTRHFYIKSDGTTKLGE